MTFKFDGWPQQAIEHLSCITPGFVHHLKPIREFKLQLQNRNAQFGSKLAIFFPVWPWNLMDNLDKQKGTSSMLLQALSIISKPSVNSNWSDSPETLNSAQNHRYLSLMTLKFHGWPWKTIRHLFYATSGFEHHFIAICEFKLELQSEKSEFCVKIDIFFRSVTLKFDG